MKKELLLLALCMICFTSFSQPDLVHYDWASVANAKRVINKKSEGIAIAVDKEGSVYSTGYFRDTVDFDPGSGNMYLSSIDFDDMYVQKLDSNGNLLWAKSIGGLKDVSGDAIHVDKNGDVLIAGKFGGTVDFDPGSAIFNLTTSRNASAFILKLDKNGNFIWVKHLRSTTSSASSRSFATFIGSDRVGDIYLGGSIGGSVDFDPDPNVSFRLSSNSNNNNGFFMKMSSSGNLIWARVIESTRQLNINSGFVTKGGTIAVCGDFKGQADFDVGVGTVNLTPKDWVDGFVASYDVFGNFKMAAAIGGVHSFADVAHDVTIDHNGNIITAGRFASTVDFDPGPGLHLISPVSAPDVFIQKLDSNGNFIWTKTIGGPSFIFPRGVVVDDQDFIYTTGSFEGLADFDPGPAQYNLSPVGIPDIFIQKLDPLGNFVWAQNVGGVGVEESRDVEIDFNQNLYLTGRYNSTIDFDHGPAVQNRTAVSSVGEPFVLKLFQDSCAAMTLSYDSVESIGCNTNGFVKVSTLYGAAPYTYQWNTSPVTNDSILHPDSARMYTLEVSDAFQCTISSTIHAEAPAHDNSFDLNANLVPLSGFRTGYPAHVILDAFNDGCQPISGDLRLVLDGFTNYDSASITPDRISGDTLFWNFANMTYDSAHLTPIVFFNIDTLATHDDSICLGLIINPFIGDEDTSNNHKVYYYDVLNSYDPNDILVHPTGECDENYVLHDTPLTYTIRFQNLGNAPALNVYIDDSLSADLDLSTFQVIGSSHSVYTELLEGNVLRFKFDEINLPDSASNPLASQGYVIFEITPQPSLPNFTKIENKADIFFDFNEPIATNRVHNVMIDKIPCIKTITGVKPSIAKISPNIYPNPATSQLFIKSNATLGFYRIISVVGELVQDGYVTDSNVDISALKPGVYFIELHMEQDISVKRFIKK